MIVLDHGCWIPAHLFENPRKTGEIGGVGFYQTDQTFYLRTGNTKKGYPFRYVGVCPTIKDTRVQAYLQEGLIRQVRVRTAIETGFTSIESMCFSWISEKEDDRDGALSQFLDWHHIEVQFGQERPYMIVRNTARFGFIP